jgi:hypothetical protein
MIPRREFLRRACVLTGLALCGSSAARTRPAREALQFAIAFLVSKQSADGAWRSTKYAAFRDGDALTPLVLWALQYSADPSAATAIARGGEWLRRLTNERARRTEPWTGLNYPLFTFAYSAQFFATMGDSGRADLCAHFVELLRIRESLGWPANDPACGAWSDSPAPPILPADVHPPPDMLTPNLSATVLALQALAANGRNVRCQAAIPFIQRCQNYSSDASDAFSDGGFFFAMGDPIRNKAGAAGVDAKGCPRFRSYGSATCDGLIGLQLCGFTDDDPRRRAAVAWLKQRAHGMKHAGVWPNSRMAAGESLAFYHAQALAEVLVMLKRSEQAWASAQGSVLANDLIARQARDGSWAGRSPDSCEDDSILATAFAVRALARIVA